MAARRRNKRVPEVHFAAEPLSPCPAAPKCLHSDAGAGFEALQAKEHPTPAPACSACLARASPPVCNSTPLPAAGILACGSSALLNEHLPFPPPFPQLACAVHPV